MRILLPLCAILLLPTLALADVPPPGTEECNGLSAGDACVVSGEDGACVESTCSRLDYSTDPPGTEEYPCTLCEVGTAPPGGGGGGCAVGAGRGSSLPALGALFLLALVGRLRR